MALLSSEIALFAPAAQAGKGHSAPSRSFSNSKPSVQRSQAPRLQQRLIQRHHQVRQPLVLKQPLAKQPSQSPPSSGRSRRSCPRARVHCEKARRKSSGAADTGSQEPAVSQAHGDGGRAAKPRVALPVNVAPKLTLVKPPKMALAPKFTPFVLRHWKKAFFWVAVAGIGYLTIPEYYYDRWATYVDDDDYERAADLLALAALEVEDEIVRVQKPASVRLSLPGEHRPRRKLPQRPATPPNPCDVNGRGPGRLHAAALRRPAMEPALLLGAGARSRQCHGAGRKLRAVHRLRRK